MTSNNFSVEAVFADGVFRPTTPISLAHNQRVRLIINLHRDPRPWPEDVAEIYRDSADDDRRMATEMFGDVISTWPKSEDSP